MCGSECQNQVLSLVFSVTFKQQKCQISKTGTSFLWRTSQVHSNAGGLHVYKQEKHQQLPSIQCSGCRLGGSHPLSGSRVQGQATLLAMQLCADTHPGKEPVIPHVLVSLPSMSRTKKELPNSSLCLLQPCVFPSVRHRTSRQKISHH